MGWISKLEYWGYPKASDLAPALERLGLDPKKYRTPFELARDLRVMVSKPAPAGLEDIWEKVKDFLRWIWDLVKPYAPGVAGIILGGVVTSVAPGWYKAVGIIPMGLGIYDLLKKVGLVS